MARARRGIASSNDLGQVRLPEFLLSSLLIIEVNGAGLPIAGSLVVVGALILLGFSRRPSVRLHRFGWVPLAFVAIIVYVAWISLVMPHSPGAFSWSNRMLRISQMVVFMWAIGSGQLHAPSIVKGFFGGLVINVPMYYLGMTPDYYKGFLTGWVGDKNISGMYYAVIGLLALSFVKRLQTQVIIGIATFGFLWLTGSRTSIAAYMFGLFWMFFISNKSTGIRVIFAGLVVFVLRLLEEQFAHVGSFADRTGSDALRASIDAGSFLKVEATGFWGSGLGEAFIFIDNRIWLFHNSFWTLMVEGGWPYTVAIVGLMIWLTMRPFSLPERCIEKRAIQSASLVLLIVATRLGEVILTIPWAIVMGLALFYNTVTEDPHAHDVVNSPIGEEWRSFTVSQARPSRAIVG